VSCIVLNAEDLTLGVVSKKKEKYINFDKKADRILTGRILGIPIMVMLLAFVFWLTISGANVPSEMLSNIFGMLENKLLELAIHLGVPEIIYCPLIFGVYHVLTWVISVMLPPMAIFFPLFTLLEDLGYLPRIAFNLDKCFKKCSACGKQALTMCMGFGCNAVGVTGCRIIDSPRERLIAILTNCFVPCNGRFPTLISLITMFMIFSKNGRFSSLLSTLILTGFVVLGILVTFLVSTILSKTILKGQPSSFTLELPPYRKPDFLRVIVRSILDRTLFVLGRAAAVAAPAGLIIWCFANITIGGETLLSSISSILDPFARAMGLDGTILLAFILGFPANETVLPIIVMAYLSQGTISDTLSLGEMKELFVANGWTILTAVNTILFSLFHWPCSTTLLTIKKETGSLKWTFAAFIIPTLAGITICMITNLVFSLLT
ncbi:MAG: ferrous iron transporter B, partial [Clostridia bacterium]|nr:ferrous iron transporter B [Clostridia bacterium]